MASSRRGKISAATHVQSVDERRPVDRRLDPVGVDQLHFDVVGVNEDGGVRLHELGQVSLQLGRERGGFEGEAIAGDPGRNHVVSVHLEQESVRRQRRLYTAEGEEEEEGGGGGRGGGRRRGKKRKEEE